MAEFLGGCRRFSQEFGPKSSSAGSKTSLPFVIAWYSAADESRPAAQALLSEARPRGVLLHGPLHATCLSHVVCCGAVAARTAAPVGRQGWSAESLCESACEGHWHA